MAAEGPIVAVESGKLQGVAATAGSPVQIFRGVPYAKPPVGDLRWREPRRAESWQGVRAADQFGPRCMQKHMWDDMFFRSPRADEDCLYLNVWTPANLSKAASAKLPVLVYIYGGGFIAGTSDEPRYDGAAMAARGIVVVTVNYRLGIFGFFAHPQLTGESPHHASGNYGLLDQAAALAWVKRNIAAFGGDPKHITVGGESAGSMSVSGMMVSPLTRALIVGAIGESGSALPPLHLLTLADAEKKGMDFAESLQVPTLGMLRAVPADKLLSVQDFQGARWWPDIDGYYFTEPPEATYSAGKAAKAASLIGSNSQEGGAGAILGDAPPTVANYQAGLQKRYGTDADRLFQLYPAASDADVQRTATELASDSFIAAGTWNWFDHQRKTGWPTYYYYYTHVRPQPTAFTATGPAAYGALHSAEIEYALGNLDANPAYAWTDADRKVSATMSAYWANFIKTGNPNGDDLPLWPQASADAGQIQRQLIDVDTHRAPFPEQARYPEVVSILMKH
ncbi:MAG: carboxylesterase family protein [Asticcacaulis sp.]|nr:carboxylesterase family protein [Asticcacaulis sp.]